MPAKIVFLDEYSINDADLSSIIALGEYTGYEQTAPDQVIERATGAEIMIVNKIVITADILDKLPDLKLICVASTGMNNIDLEAAAGRGVEVANAKGYSTHSVAETTLGCALAILRETVYYDGFVKNGGYCASERMFNFDRPTHQLYGRNWGIIGLGTIGRRVAGLADAFGCKVAYHSTSGTERPEDYPRMTLYDLLAWSDIVSVHAPLNEKTRDLIGSAELSAMKPSAIIINVARGGIVNERALADALNAGTISAAALDVFAGEPIACDNPLLQVEDKYKLLLSPHNAWSADGAIENLIGCIADNIKRYLSR